MQWPLRTPPYQLREHKIKRVSNRSANHLSLSVVVGEGKALIASENSKAWFHAIIIYQANSAINISGKQERKTHHAATNIKIYIMT